MPQTMTRREFLRYSCLATAGAFLGSAARGHAAPPRRPNFVFILSDDQSWAAMSNPPNRWPFLKTPNMDRLATEGARFENAFVTISLCSPSRACFLTGRYAHAHGVCWNNGTGLDPQMPTYPQLLHHAGYRTALVGKWHMDPTSAPRPGFDYWLSFVDQGVYENPPLQENDRKFQAQGHMTELLTNYATAWLRRQDSPFCLCLHHKSVHGPFTPTPKNAKAFADAEIAEPPNWRDTFADKPAWMRREKQYGARDKTEQRPVADEIPPVPWNPQNTAQRNYLRSVLDLDDSLGSVLQTLEQMGQLDNTVVVYTSDNGYFMGEHRRGDKRAAFEESMRIPLLVRYPGLVAAGARLTPMALNLDVAPTFLDLAGVEAPAGMQGRSWRPLFEGQPANWRQSFLYEYFRENWLPGIPTMLAVRTERWKYVTYPDLQDLDELYDLQADPTEMHNLSQDPAHATQLATMKAELERLKRETQYVPPQPVGVPMKDVPVALVLSFDFAADEGTKVADGSGKGNGGVAHGAELVAADGGKARRFDGKGYLAVDRSDSLDPAQRAFTVSATVKAEKPDGIILARGGQTQGYALRLVGGKPQLLLRSGGALATVTGPDAVPEGWVTLTGMLTRDLRLVLSVNGQEVARTEVDAPVAKDPNEGLEIGMDRGTRVGEYGEANGFTGLIRQVRIWQGEGQ
ncbi:MAG: sulfatase-like hydrolase/transferase [Armatimonadetes bacterium]|nr:sulfatase-like hydrolase/transferase [Armatimonadota bacterium]